MRLQIHSLKAQAGIGALFVGVVLLVAGMLVALLNQKQTAALSEFASANEVIHTEIIPLQKEIAGIKLDVIQVQQFLQDLAATRGQNGLNDGGQEAEKFALELQTRLTKAGAIAKTLGLNEIISTLEQIRAKFGPYYDVGKRMTAAYVAQGPAGGNAMMPQFDAAADAMSEQLDRLIMLTDGLTSERTQSLNEKMKSLEQLNAANVERLMICAGLIVLIVLLALWFVIRVILNPVGGVSDLLTQLSRGEFGFNVSFSQRRDEIGAMGLSILTLKESLAEAERVRASQDEERERQQAEKIKAIKSIADMLEQESRNAVEQVAKGTQTMTGNAVRMVQSVQSVSVNSDAVASAAKITVGSAQGAAAASEELAASISEISRQLQMARNVTREAVDASGLARNTITNLSSTVTRIGAVSQMINDIAGQTNLLALNATIEAARAGEAGKGFAVVAQEVKSLANQTAKATGDISEQIQDIQRSTQDAVDSVTRITDAIREVEAVTANVAAAVEEQSAATSEIARNAEQTSLAAQDAATRIAQVAIEAKTASDLTAEVKSVANVVADHVTELQSAIIRTVRTSAPDADRRESARSTLHVNAIVRIGGQSHKAVLIDLSEGGAGLRCDLSTEIGRPAELTLEGFGPKLPAMIVGCDAGRSRLQFHSLKDQVRVELERQFKINLGVRDKTQAA